MPVTNATYPAKQMGHLGISIRRIEGRSALQPPPAPPVGERREVRLLFLKVFVWQHGSFFVCPASLFILCEFIPKFFVDAR